jgi:hypothetical protein
VLHLVEMVSQGHNADNVERLWEAQLQQLGTQGYEQSLDGKEFSQTSAGKWFLQDAHRVVEKAIEELQASTIRMDRRSREDRATLPMVPARSLTGIVLKTLIDRTMGNTEERHRGVTMQSLVKAVSSSVELTLKLMCDIQDSREEAKRWFAEHGEALGLKTPPLSNAEKFLKDHDKKVRQRWRGSLKEVLDYKWSLAQQYYCGDALVLTAVEALRVEAEARGHTAPFLVHNPLVKSKRARRVKVTPEFAEMLDRREIRKADYQVIRLPMLSRPAAWAEE